MRPMRHRKPVKYYVVLDPAKQMPDIIVMQIIVELSGAYCVHGSPYEPQPLTRAV